MNELARFLAALGTKDAADASKALAAHGEAGLDALCAALVTGARLGPADANGRAVFEDLEAHLVAMARAHPTALVRAAEKEPRLREQFAFVSALTAVAPPLADDQLVALLDSRRGDIRWLVLEALVAREEPRAIARLGKAAADRDGLVVFTAVTALRRWGTPGDLARLETIAASPRTPPGTREASLDAIEAICERAGLAPPEVVLRRR